MLEVLLGPPIWRPVNSVNIWPQLFERCNAIQRINHYPVDSVVFFC